MKITAIYMRVSTTRQDMASQEPELKRYAERCEGEVCWYRDQVTGKKMDRPGWKSLEARIYRGEVERVVVWRLDRLGRTARGLTKLFDELARKRVDLVSLREGFTLGTAAGRLMANVLASVAQFETELRVERILAGQAAARAKGKKWGGSQRGTRRVVTKEQLEVVRRMASIEGFQKAAIARATGLSRQTVYALLRELKIPV